MTNKARKAVKRLTPLFLLPLLPLFNACYEYDENDRQESRETVSLTFYLQSTGQQATRGYEGIVSAEGNEDTFYDVRVWLFDCSDASNPLLLDYQQVTDDSKKVTMSVPKYIITNDIPVDVYAIANAGSVDLTGLGASTNITGLQAATLGGTNFTPTTLTTAVPATGLPFSCIVHNLKLANTDKTDIRTDLEVIKMTRAVSKIRFAFAKVNGNTAAEVVGIKLNGGVIAQNELILPKDPATNPNDYTEGYWGDRQVNLEGNTYFTDDLVLGSTDGTATYLANSAINVPQNDVDPSGLAWENNTSLTAQEYENLLVNNATNRVVYFRESDKKLSGTIYYRLQAGGEIFNLPFEMDSESLVQDFARNHEWIVYGYFKGNRLVLRATVIPWYYWLAETDYKENVTMTEPLQWSGYQSITDQTMTIEGQSVNCKVVALRANGTVECKFIFDTPYHGTWYAMLESVNDTESDALVFADNTTVQTGTVGSEVTLTIKARNANATSNHYSRLRFVCYSESGTQAYAVGSDILGGNFVIAQYAN